MCAPCLCVSLWFESKFKFKQYADVWDEDPSGFEDDEEQEELTAQQQALASFHQKMVSLLSALTSIAHSGVSVGQGTRVSSVCTDEYSTQRGKCGSGHTCTYCLH